MIFLDSSVIIEGLKKESVFKEAKDLLKSAVINHSKFCINEVVFDEVLYWFVKRKVDLKKYSKVLFLFELKPLNKDFTKLWIEFIDKYGLKPHDALILATCKHYSIPYLLSLDKDFEEVCKRERIVLINSVENLEKVFKSE